MALREVKFTWLVSSKPESRPGSVFLDFYVQYVFNFLCFMML